MKINAAARLSATELKPYRRSTDRDIKVRVEPSTKVKFLNGYQAGNYMKTPNVKPPEDLQFDSVDDAVDWLRQNGYTVVQ